MSCSLKLLNVSSLTVFPFRRIRSAGLFLIIVAVFVAYKQKPQQLFRITLYNNNINDRRLLLLIFNPTPYYESVFNYLHFKTIYSRKQNLDPLFLINIFENKIDRCSVMEWEDSTWFTYV
jgi:hypothetical protein